MSERKVKRAYGYARVSTPSQDLDAQIEKIQKFCTYRGIELMGVYTDKASGKDTDRQGFQKMLRDLELRAHMADVVIVHELDRLGRSLSDLIRIAEWFKAHQIDLVSTEESIDTTTSTGRLFFHISGAFAEYERALIIERVKLGQEAAKEKGVKFGPKVKEVDRAKVERLLALGVSKAEVARKLKIARNTLYLRLREWAEEDLNKEVRTAGQEE
jgi:DNA invertase Pin-like site-specific DNA recombinase